MPRETDRAGAASPVLRIALVALAAVALLAGCGSDDKTAAQLPAGSSSGASAAPVGTGPLTVFAAASLTEAFQDEAKTLETGWPDLDLTYNFAGSGALATQIEQGAPADVVATADTATMKRLSDAGDVEAPVTFARNKLEILVAPGNPKQIKGLTDLARSDVKMVTEDETVPAGKYSAQILATAGVTVQPVSKEADVKGAVAKVTIGEADATIVYVTDVKAAGSKGEGVEIPDAVNVIAVYPIAIVKATKNRAAAEAFIKEIVHGGGQAALQARGFLAAA